MSERDSTNPYGTIAVSAGCRDVTFETEYGLGIAKLRLFRGPHSDAQFYGLHGITAPPQGEQVECGLLSFSWMAPCEWLVYGPARDIANWLRHTDDHGGAEVLAIDFSHALVPFLLGGAGARTALAAHCPLDLWPATFRPGAVARSLLGEANVFIARLTDSGDLSRFRIIVDETMAGYATRLLTGP